MIKSIRTRSATRFRSEAGMGIRELIIERHTDDGLRYADHRHRVGEEPGFLKDAQMFWRPHHWPGRERRHRHRRYWSKLTATR